jgi:hypothetical protein
VKVCCPKKIQDYQTGFVTVSAEVGVDDIGLAVAMFV